MAARIYKPARTAMQSGTAKTKEWVLDYEPEQPRAVEPLMGWTSSGDMKQQLRLQAGLLPSAAGARVALAGGKVTVTDGPFTESKELISYAVYDVRSKEEAIEWASRFVKLHRDLWPGWSGQTDIHQVMGPGGGG